MDQNTPPPGKSYSEVMNEWAAQQAFVKGNRSRLLHPPYESHPLAKLLGYLARLLVFLLLPAGIYIYLVLKWAGGPEFNKMITDGLKPALNAASLKSASASWQLSGQLAMPALDATGAPGAFYETLHAETVSTRVPLPMFVRRDWVLPRVNLASLDIALRSGGAGTVPIYELPEEELNMEPFLQDQNSGGKAPSPPAGSKKSAALPRGQTPQAPSAPVLTAGYGINPNFGALLINSVQIGKLNLKWGGGPASSGALTGTQADLTRSSNGWKIDFTGGQFHLGWLEDWSIVKSSLNLSPGKASIAETPLTHSSAGQAKFTGDVTLGDVPEVFGTLHLDGVKLQELIAPEFSTLFSAEVSGDLRLSGSTNRSSGIQTQGTLTIDSGRFSPLPIFNALQSITGETMFTGLPLKGGRFSMKSGGTEGSSGTFVEVPSFEITTSVCKLRGHLRHERSRPLGTQLDTPATAEKITASGLVRIGLPPVLAAKFPPAVAAKYLVKGEDGWSWIDFKFEGAPNAELTAALASEMILLSTRP